MYLVLFVLATAGCVGFYWYVIHPGEALLHEGVAVRVESLREAELTEEERQGRIVAQDDELQAIAPTLRSLLDEARQGGDLESSNRTHVAETQAFLSQHSRSRLPGSTALVLYDSHYYRVTLTRGGALGP